MLWPPAGCSLFSLRSWWLILSFIAKVNVMSVQKVSGHKLIGVRQNLIDNDRVVSSTICIKALLQHWLLESQWFAVLKWDVEPFFRTGWSNMLILSIRLAHYIRQTECAFIIWSIGIVHMLKNRKKWDLSRVEPTCRSFKGFNDLWPWLARGCCRVEGSMAKKSPAFLQLRVEAYEACAPSSSVLCLDFDGGVIPYSEAEYGVQQHTHKDSSQIRDRRRQLQ